MSHRVTQDLLEPEKRVTRAYYYRLAINKMANRLQPLSSLDAVQRARHYLRAAAPRRGLVSSIVPVQRKSLPCYPRGPVMHICTTGVILETVITGAWIQVMMRCQWCWYTIGIALLSLVLASVLHIPFLPFPIKGRKVLTPLNTRRTPIPIQKINGYAKYPRRQSFSWKE